MGRDEDAEHAVLAFPIDRGRAGYESFVALLGHEPDGADLFGDEHAAIGQERDAPGKFKGGDGGQVEGNGRFGLLFSRVDLSPGGRGGQGQKQSRFCQFHWYFSLINSCPAA